MNPVSRITGEGRAEFLRTWGPDFDQKGDGRGGGGKGQVGQLNLCVEAINPSCGGRRGGMWRGGREGGGAGGALGRIDVGVYYTRCARSRRWCGWWERRGRYTPHYFPLLVV